MESEEVLLLLLGRLSFDNLTKTRIFHLLKKGIDWYEFLNICVRKKLICLAYKNLTELNLIQLLPMIVIDNMQYHYEQNLEQNKKFLQVSAPIISFLKSNSYLAEPVKGLKLLTSIYNKVPGVRILNDIDFIVSSIHQNDIHEFMIKSGFKPYLVNDQDVLCVGNKKVKSYFYINFEGKNPYGKLRVDFDFSYSDKWIKAIQLKKQHVYEFLYLCNEYYKVMADKIQPKNISTYDYSKLIDIHEYYIRYLKTLPKEDILTYANEMNVRKPALFTVACLKKIYTDF